MQTKSLTSAIPVTASVKESATVYSDKLYVACELVGDLADFIRVRCIQMDTQILREPDHQKREVLQKQIACLEKQGIYWYGVAKSLEYGAFSFLESEAGKGDFGGIALEYLLAKENGTADSPGLHDVHGSHPMIPAASQNAYHDFGFPWPEELDIKA